MTNREMLETAMRQSAIDMGCDETDYLKDTNVIKPLILGVNARKYLKEPITCNLVSYGNNIVASVTEPVSDIVAQYIDKFEFYHCFETPNMMKQDCSSLRILKSFIFPNGAMLCVRTEKNSMYWGSVLMIMMSLSDLRPVPQTVMKCGR